MATTLLEAVTSWESSIKDLQVFVEQYNKFTTNLITPLRAQANQPDIDGNTVESILERVNNQLAGLVHLEEKLKSIRVDLNRCRNVSKNLSPVSRIPPEVLTYIVSLVNEEEEAKHRQDKELQDIISYPPPTSSFTGVFTIEDPEYKAYLSRIIRPRHFPMLFSHVCRSWRDAILSTASLWTKIGPYFGTEMANLYLSRSKECPLELSLLQFSTMSASHWRKTPQLRMVRDNAHRIASLDVCIHGLEQTVMTLDELAKASILPPTRRLKVEVRGDSGSWLTPSSTDINYDEFLAGIRSLDLSVTFFPWNSVAYADLRELRLCSIRASADEIYTVLSASPLLESLSLERASVPDSTVRSHRLILLNSLHTLKVSGMGASSRRTLNGLLHMLHTPNLVKLCINTLGDSRAALETFVRRLSSPILQDGEAQEAKIQVLHIQRCQDLDNDLLTRLFKLLPNIVDLGLHNLSAITNSILTSLAACDDGSVIPRLLPKLQSLRFTWCGTISSLPMVKDVIQSRLEASKKSENGVRIERLVLMHCAIDWVDMKETRSWLSQNVRYFITDYAATLAPEQAIEDEGHTAGVEGEGNEPL